jgi:hypothetical protein
LSVTPSELSAGAQKVLERMDARAARADRRWEEEQRRWAERDRKWAERERENERKWAGRDLDSERKWERRDRENREFLDALLGRSANMNDEMIRALRSFQVEMHRELADGRDQVRANTEAVLRLIDERFGPEPAG